MSLKTVRLCIVCVVIFVIYCAANPIGKPEPSTRDENKTHVSKDVFLDVAKILSDANHEAKKSSPDSNRSNSGMPAIKLRHPKHNRRNPFARGPRDQDMLKGAPKGVQGDRVRKRKSSKPHGWRPEWDSPQLASHNAYPYQPYDYISHPFYNYHYSGYDNWYFNQIPNYHSYNVPPEHEWKTTAHEGPEVEWTAHIAFPDMEPIIITNKNYTSSKSNVQVIINKSEPKYGRNNARHVPVPGPRDDVDPNAITSTSYSYAPSITPAVNKNIKHSFEPITWTATVDYPHSQPIIMKGVIPQVQGPVHYVNPPGPQIAGQGYYYPYNAAPVQWPASPYNNIPWTSGYGGYPVLTNPPPTYPVLTNPPPVYQWPSVPVSYPSAYPPPYSPPHGGKPPLKSDDDNDDDDEDDDNGDDENGNDDKDDGDDGDDNGDVKDEDEVSDPMNETYSNEDEANVSDNEEASGSGDRTNGSKDDGKETEPKKGFFSWG